MRRFILFATLTILFLGIALLASGAYLADNQVFSPGSFFFPLQEMAEGLQSALYQSPQSLFEYRLQIALRRLDDLTDALGKKDEANALEAFILALDQLSAAYSKLSPEDQPALEAAKASLVALLDRADPVMRRLSVVPNDFPSKFAEVETKLHVMRLILANPNLAPADLSEVTKLTGAEAPAAPGPGVEIMPVVTIVPQMVQFLPGSKGALHAFFPLTGKHSTLVCESCHTTGLYRGTNPSCAACHADVIPANHYPADCVLCHTSNMWKEIIFTHPAGAVADCQSCHNRDKPGNHYPGQCSACHSTTAWKPANFNHAVAGATDCLACHADVRPVNHYQGQCSACHSTEAWKPATFNHAVAGATDCQSCHTKDKPANHYAGQCSACHDTSAWLPATFNHSAVNATDCQSCHANNRPANHYAGQCSACHNTNAWKPASFNHAVVDTSNCQSCHNPPAGHYNAQCSACHNTNAWRPYSFNHAAIGATDCQSCHSRPANHFQGQCSNCHSTSGWTPANFSHDFPMDHGNAGGDCAKCHPGGTGSWTCYTCHDQAEMESKHAEKGISNIGSRCLECHPTGNKD